MKFARAQLEALERVIDGMAGSKETWQKTRKHLMDLHAKLEKLSAPKIKVKSGIGVDRAITAMREVLGDKLAVPKHPSEFWLMMQSKRIRDLGLSEDDCRTIARNIAAKWNSPYSFEYCIRAADRLLVEKHSRPKEAAPAEMEEWE
jgi:hypothetical protein